MDDTARHARAAVKATAETARTTHLSQISDEGSMVKSAIKGFQDSYSTYRNEAFDTGLEALRKEKDSFMRALKSNILKSERYQGLETKLDDIASKSDAHAKNVAKLREEMRSDLYNLISKNRKEHMQMMQDIGFKEEQADELYDVVQGLKKEIPYEKSRIDAQAAEFQNKVMDNIIKQHESRADMSFYRRMKRKAGKKLKGLFGYREATLNDYIRLHNDKTSEIELSEEALSFANKLQEKGADPDKFVVDSTKLIGPDGKLIDVGGFSKAKHEFRNAFARGILGKVTYQHDFMMLNKYHDKVGHIMRGGRHQPFLADTGVVRDDYTLKETLVGIGSEAYRISDPSQPVKTGLDFTSGRYASMRRLAAQMSGINAPENYSRWYESKALDINTHQQPGMFRKALSVFRKAGDPNWKPNRFKKLRAYAIKEGEEIPDKLMKEFENYMRMEAPAMSDDILGRLAKSAGFEDMGFKTSDDLVEAYVKLERQNRPIDETALADKAYGILEQSNVKTRTGILQSNVMETGDEILKKQIGQTLIKENGVDDTLKILDGMRREGKISKELLESARISVASFQYHSAYKHSIGTGDEFVQLFNDENFIRGAQNLLQKTHPTFSGVGPFKEVTQNFKSDTLAINQFDPTSLSSIKNAFTAGRGNMGDVNKATVGIFGMVSKLNNLVRTFDFLPVALSDRSMGSTPQAIKSIMTKRVLPVYAGLSAFQWANDYMPEVTGYTIHQHEERTKARVRMKTAGLQKSLGITRLMKGLDRATPGSEGLETVMGDIPIAGWAADWAGLFSKKTPKEWSEYYIHGEDPVRSNRYWPLGQTPWMGQGVSHYEPNSYKQAMSQWKYTSTVYGSRDKYWSHHWMPTPSHPLAPVRHFITDPYWFEKMHKKDRPYPISGGLFDPNTPWGMVLNPTIGKLLKPRKDYGAGASEEDLRKQAEKERTYGQIIYSYNNGNMDRQMYIPKYSIPDRTPVLYGTGEGRGAAESRGQITAINEGIKAGAEDIRAVRRSGVSHGVYPERKPVHAVQKEGAQRTQGSSKVVIGETQSETAVVTGSGQRISMETISQINRNIINKAGEIGTVNVEDLEKTGFVAPYYGNRVKKDPKYDRQDPRSLQYQLKQGATFIREALGFLGFMGSEAAGGRDYGAGEAVPETAAKAYAGSYRFWEMSPGGRGGAVSEVLRRFILNDPGLQTNINNRPNMMPDWLPQDFQTGDPYRAVKRGEIRLPGEAYTSMHTLHPDRYGEYGAVDRAAILADVAPYSQEFKYWMEIARSQDLTAEEQDFLQRAVEQKRKQSERYHLTPYQFVGKGVKRQQATVKKFIDSNRFMVQGSDQVYRLAGVHASFNPKTESGRATMKVLGKHMLPGQEVTLLTEQHARGKTKPAVVYSTDKSQMGEVGSWRVNVNNLLRKRGVTKREESGVIGTYTELNAAGRAIGHVWEAIAHTRIPVVQNKLLNVKSPREHLEQEQIYGKTFQSWGEPIEDQVKPAFQNAWAQHPIGGGVSGAFAGAIIGKLFFGNPGMKAGATLGSIVGVGGSIVRMSHEMDSGEAWIPESEEKKREINRYFDRLKYVKYKRLYNKYKKMAAEREGVNVEELQSRLENIEKKVDKKEAMLKNLKRNVSRSGVGGDYVKTYVNDEGRLVETTVTDEDYLRKKRREINADIKKIKNKETMVGLGELSRKALRYKKEYESTLYGLDEDSTHNEIYSALPDKHKEYFKHFSKIKDPEERKELLKLLPQGVQRAYKLLWHKQSGSKESLEEYFSDYYLPEEDWVGWKEGIELEDAKAKLVEDRGYDPKDFGIWQDYTEKEELTPSPTPVGEDYKKANISPSKIEKALKEVMTNYDMKNVKIEVSPREDDQLNIEMDIEQDIRGNAKGKIDKVMAS